MGAVKYMVTCQNVCRREKYGIENVATVVGIILRTYLSALDQGCTVNLLCGGGEESGRARCHSVEGMAVEAGQPVANVLSQLSDLDTLNVKVDFVAFIATVINCTAQMSMKSNNLDIIISAAEKFLGLQDCRSTARTIVAMKSLTLAGGFLRLCSNLIRICVFFIQKAG